MANPVTFGSCKEIIYYVLEYLEPEVNVGVMAVCTSWRDVAADIAKKQYCVRAERDLNLKMKNFLAMVGGTAIDYCPALKKLKEERGSKTVNEIRTQLSGLTEKHSVVLDEGHIVGEDKYEKLKRVLDSILATEHFVEEEHAARMEGIKRTREFLGPKIEDDYCGKPFVGLFSRTTRWHRGSQWMLEGVFFFPIALFNLKMEGLKITGEHPQGSYCVPLKGRLIEFFIDPRPLGLFDAPRVGLFNSESHTAHIMPKIHSAAYYNPTSEALYPFHLNRNHKQTD